MKNLLRLAMLVFIATLGLTMTSAHAEPTVVDKDEIHNVIEFDGAFNEASVDALIEEIQDSVDLDEKEIRIKFNSPGGSIFAGFKLLNKISVWQGKGFKFIGIVDRGCMSMCFMTLQHLDVRLAYKYAMLLDHPASGGINKRDLREISEILNEKVLERLKAKGLSKIAIKQYQLLVLDEFFMNSRTALALGLIDKIINPGEENVSKIKVSK